MMSHFSTKTPGINAEIDTVAGSDDDIDNGHFVTLRANHIWFHGWADFVTPESHFEASLNALVDRAAAVLASSHGTVVVSCVSGRGRSGTFAAMALGRARGVKTVSELVDLVVELRRHRDGLVETPRQFALAARVLGINALVPNGAPVMDIMTWVVCIMSVVALVAASILITQRKSKKKN